MNRWALTWKIRGYKNDEGTVLILGIGLVGVCLLAFAVVMDTTSAFMQRRSLYSLADAAALAGSQTVDLDSYYANGAGEGTSLDAGSVTGKARAFLQSVQSEHPGLRIVAVTTDGAGVRVELSAPVRLPFLGALRSDVIRVRSTARLDYRPSQQQ
jgi:threonine dehydrogenase-like Zn-dependent dehydrogenase